MKNIIDNLYNLTLSTNYTLATGIHADNREWELYDFLCSNLSKELLSTFMEYTKIRSIRESNESKLHYSRGFKTAVSIFLECKEEP